MKMRGFMTKEKDVLICDNCGKEVAEDASFCTGCGIEFEDEWSDRSKKKQEEQERQEIKRAADLECNNRYKELKLTSGYSFEGFHITEYLDICTGICVLGTGFLSTIGANWADFLGTSSTGYENKLEEAKEKAMRDLKKKAINIGGNAIIGIDLDYTTFSSDIIGVVVNGTAVIIESIE